jgi:hypothetical protein
MYWAVYHCGPRWGDVGYRIAPCGSDAQKKEKLAYVRDQLNQMQYGTLLSGEPQPVQIDVRRDLDILERSNPSSGLSMQKDRKIDLRQPTADNPDFRVTKKPK